MQNSLNDSINRVEARCSGLSSAFSLPNVPALSAARTSDAAVLLCPCNYEPGRDPTYMYLTTIGRLPADRQFVGSENRFGLVRLNTLNRANRVFFHDQCELEHGLVRVHVYTCVSEFEKKGN